MEHERCETPRSSAVASAPTNADRALGSRRFVECNVILFGVEF